MNKQMNKTWGRTNPITPDLLTGYSAPGKVVRLIFLSKLSQRIKLKVLRDILALRMKIVSNGEKMVGCSFL